MRKKYTIHTKRKYTKNNKIKKSKNKIKYTKKYKKKLKTKRKQRGAGFYDTIDDPNKLREIIIDKDAELEGRDTRLEQATELIQKFLAKNEELEGQLEELSNSLAERQLKNLSKSLAEAEYRTRELEEEIQRFKESESERESEREIERTEIEELKYGLENEMRGIKNERIRKEELEKENAQLRMENRVIGTNNIQYAEKNGILKAENSGLNTELEEIKERNKKLHLELEEKKEINQKLRHKDNESSKREKVKNNCLTQIGEKLDPIISDLVI